MSDRLKKLTKNEITVLYWKCKGLKYDQIAARLGYSKDWVQVQASNVYTKLGFEKTMHWTKRAEILEREICPLLPKDLKDWKPTEETPALEPEVITPDPEMMALVLYDEKQLEEVKNKAITPPRQEVIVIREPTKGVKIFRRILFAIVSILIVLVVGYVAYNAGRGATPAPVVFVITATSIPATETLLPTATSAIPTETATSVPTNTPAPTITPIPTEFIPPADGILFQDNFESGDLSAWTQYSGEWIVSNGRLTMLANDIDSFCWIALKRPEWKNYILSVKVYIPSQGSAAQETAVIAVRNEGSQSKFLGVPVDVFSESYWAFIDSSYTPSIAGENRPFKFESGSTMELEVSGDTYVLRVNGREIQRVTLSGYNSGGISLGMECDYRCPQFDDVKVTYLP